MGTLTPRKTFSIDDHALTGFIDAHEPLLGVFTGSLTPSSLNLPVSEGSLTPSEGHGDAQLLSYAAGFLDFAAPHRSTHSVYRFIAWSWDAESESVFADESV